MQKKKNTKNSKYTIKMLQQESNWTTSTLIYPPEPFHCAAFLSCHVCRSLFRKNASKRLTFAP